MGDKIHPLTLSTFCPWLLRENKINKGTTNEETPTCCVDLWEETRYLPWVFPFLEQSLLSAMEKLVKENVDL